MSEIRFAARRLLKDPWSAAAAILVTALGAGLNTAVFAFAYGVLVRPLPYRDATDLAVLTGSVPFARVHEWRSGLSTFEQIAAYAREGATVRGLAEPRFVPVALVDDMFFGTLGAVPLAGRAFGPSDTGAVAIVSQRLALQASSSPESLLGRSITVGDTVATVIGVMPEAFAFPTEGTAVWIPARAARAIAFDNSVDARPFRLFGRLNPGVTLARARENIDRVQPRLDPEFKPGGTPRIGITSLHEELVGRSRPVLLVFATAAGIVLLVACANVATMLIGRTIARRRELGIVAALGASRSRLFATIWAESSLIAVAGVALGAVLAVGAIRIVSAWAAGVLPRLGDVRVDWSMLGFALAVTALSSILAAAPALRSTHSSDLTARAGIGGPPAAARARSVLAVLQIALAVLLLSAGALLTRTLVQLLHDDIGAERRAALVSQLMMTDAIAFDAAGQRAWLNNLLQHVRAIPGTTAAGVGSSLPPDNALIEVRLRLVDGVDGNEEKIHELSLASVTPEYLQALGTPLRQGRYFEDADERRGDFVAVLSESAARGLLPDVNPIGQQLPMPVPGMRERGRPTVIGVVADVKYGGLEKDAGPAIYVLWKELPAGQLYLALRTQGEPLVAARTLATVLRQVDPRMPVMQIRRLEEVVRRSVVDRRLRALLAGSVALLALAIALVGLAGGLASMVSERRHEFAIRAALGATPARALRMLMGQGTVLAAMGITVGTLTTLAAGSVLQSLVHGVSPHDPPTLALVAAVVAAGSLLACYLPARRAASANPLDVLRDQ